MNEAVQAYIGVGSNIGDKVANIRGALEQIERRLTSPAQISPIYETEPRFDMDQSAFLNAVVGLKTILEPADIMAHLLSIEASMGRLREQTRPKGPRIIDLDLLAVGQAIVHTDRLTLPHPGIQDRRFVLCPWADLEPSWEHPLTGQTVAQMLAQTPDQGWIRVFKDTRSA